MTEIVKQEEKASEDEIIKVKKSVVVEYILKDRKQHMKMQQERYRAMNDIQKINMRYLFFMGILVVLVVILLMFNVAKVVATQDTWAMFMGVINVLTLFIFASGIEEAMHWWDEEEERTGGYLADTETD